MSPMEAVQPDSRVDEEQQIVRFNLARLTALTRVLSNVNLEGWTLTPADFQYIMHLLACELNHIREGQPYDLAEEGSAL